MFRGFALTVLLGCLAISAYYRRRARLESGTIARRREGTPLLALRSTIGLIILASVLTHILVPDWMSWASFAPRDWASWIGVGLGVLLVPAVYWVFVSLGRNVSETVLTKQTHELITSGPYGWVRHPLYTAGIALLVSLGLMVGSWLILALASLAFVLIWWLVVPREERNLVHRFGDEYRAYMLRTGRFLPRLTGEPMGPGAAERNMSDDERGRP